MLMQTNIFFGRFINSIQTTKYRIYFQSDNTEISSGFRILSYISAYSSLERSGVSFRLSDTGVYSA